MSPSPRVLCCAAALIPLLSVAAAGVLWQVTSPVPGDRFGTSLAAVGDVDGDGVTDVLVGAPRAQTAGILTGRVALLSGSDGTEWLGVTGDASYDAFGTSVDGAGDVDGDGVPDLLVGSPAGTPPAGSVHLLSGKDGAPLLMLVGDANGDRFGEAVAGVGDVDGDGVPDVAVGAPQADGLGTNGGRVSVYSGVDGSEHFTHQGAAFDHLGQAVAAAGDVDGDGRIDVLVGAPLADGLAFNGGAGWLFSGRDGSVLAAHHGTGVGDQLGHWLAGIGDVDGDGTPDLAFGVPGSDEGALDAGAVVVHSGATGALLLFVPGLDEGGGLGVVARAGDVDRDGHLDLAVGAPTAAGHAGRVRVISGATGLDLMSVEGTRPGEWFGLALAGVGDVDGNGRADLVAGAPGHDDMLDKAGLVRGLSP